ncbi:MAG: leucine-rich repeat domain-containing protein [Ruminococcus sp.]|nr:leucine-rich repeat domain-containing protein [Ruminococcus sp.]
MGFIIKDGILHKYEENKFFRKTAVRIPYGVRAVSVRAFANCTSLEKIIIPDSVKIIGSNAFSGCINLKELTIPESVEIIQRSAFPEHLMIQIQIGHNLYTCKAVAGIVFSAVRNLLTETDYENGLCKGLSAEIKYSLLFQKLNYHTDSETIREYLLHHCTEAFSFLLETYPEQLPHVLSECLTQENIDSFIREAIKQQSYEIQMIFTNYKYQHFEFRAQKLEFL